MNDAHTPDTHGAAGEPWIGFDLDGTLAVYDTWKGIDHIGAPVAPMVELIKRLHAEGKRVKIVTARVAPRSNTEYKARERCAPPDYAEKADLSGLPADAKTGLENMYLGLDAWGAREFVVNWCLKHLGFLPEITHEKDHLMLELYDDRVKQVLPNDGSLVEDLARDAILSLKRCEADLGWSMFKLNSKFINFISGLMMGLTIMLLVFSGYEAFKAWRQEDNAVYRHASEVHDAVRRLMEVMPAAWPTNGTEQVVQ